MEPITISLPIYIQVNSKTNFALNLNQYRNAHYHILNKAKVLFEEAVKPLLSVLPQMTKLKLTYTLFFGSKRAVDTANICSIVDKFFSDTLVNNQIIPDDNNNIISDIDYRFGGIDVQNPRVDVTISDYQVTEKEEDMRIILVQSEIEAAITNYVHQQIALKEGQSVTIEFKNTRGEDGATAEVNIGLAPAKQTAPLKPQTSTPAGSQTAAGSTNALTQLGTQTPAESVQEEAPVVHAQPTTSTPVEGSTAGTAVPDAVIDEPEQNPAPAIAEPKEQAPAETSAPKSLFGNLTKPVNN